MRHSSPAGIRSTVDDAGDCPGLRSHAVGSTAPRWAGFGSIAVVAVLTLAGCVTPESESGTSSSPSASAEAPTGSTAADAPPAARSIPTECEDVVSPEVYAATFSGFPLNDPGVTGTEVPYGSITPSPPPAGATPREILSSATQLRCIWKDPQADITALGVDIGAVDVAVADDYLAGLPAEGYTCEELHGGTRCQLISTHPQYGVPVGQTSFLRDDVFIDVGQANFETNDLLGAIVARTWG